MVLQDQLVPIRLQDDLQPIIFIVPKISFVFFSLGLTRIL